MPIYEYKCAKCAFQEEYLQKLSEPPMTVCPSCGKQAFKKMLSAAGFQLKGSGWYATDFKGSGTKPAAAKTEAKGEAGSDAKGEAKGDSKTDSKTDSKADSKAESKSEPKTVTAPASGTGAAPATTTN